MAGTVAIVDANGNAWDLKENGTGDSGDPFVPSVVIDSSALPAGAATEATLAALLAEGAPITGTSLPAGGSHALGWLSALYREWVRRQQQAQTLVASAAYTTDQTSGDQTNLGCRGAHVILNVTNAAAGGSVTVKIQGKDPASGTYYDLLLGTAVTTVGYSVYKIYPGIGALTNQATSDTLPLTWRVYVTANNGNALTYSVGAHLIP